MSYKKVSIPRITLILIALNIAAMVIEITVYGTAKPMLQIMKGAFFAPSFKYGEWWRILTSAFFHLGMLTLITDMVALFIVGSQLEKVFTGAQYLLIFFAGAVAGNLLQFIYEEVLMAGQNFYSCELAGTSAAILGLTGAYIVSVAIRHSGHEQRSIGLNIIVTAIMLLVNHGAGTSIFALIGSLIGATIVGAVITKCAHSQA